MHISLRMQFNNFGRLFNDKGSPDSNLLEELCNALRLHFSCKNPQNFQFDIAIKHSLGFTELQIAQKLINRVLQVSNLLVLLYDPLSIIPQIVHLEEVLSNGLHEGNKEGARSEVRAKVEELKAAKKKRVG